MLMDNNTKKKNFVYKFITSLKKIFSNKLNGNLNNSLNIIPKISLMAYFLMYCYYHHDLKIFNKFSKKS